MELVFQLAFLLRTLYRPSPIITQVLQWAKPQMPTLISPLVSITPTDAPTAPCKPPHSVRGRHLIYT